MNTVYYKSSRRIVHVVSSPERTITMCGRTVATPNEFRHTGDPVSCTRCKSRSEARAKKDYLPIYSGVVTATVPQGWDKAETSTESAE